MSRPIVAFDLDEFDKFKVEVLGQLSKDIDKIRGMVVEKPMTMKEAAAFLNIHVNTLGQYVKTGKIKAHRLGKYPMFYPSELNAQIKAMKS